MNKASASKSKKHQTVEGLIEIPTSEQVRGFAIEVSGNKEAGEQWFKRPHPLLGNHTPEEVTLEGKGSEAIGILQNIAGI